jgi:hypothetical protein
MVNYGEVEVQIRVENRTPKTMQGLLLDPWMPEGFVTMRLPLVENLAPGDIVHIPVETLSVNQSAGISG